MATNFFSNSIDVKNISFWVSMLTLMMMCVSYIIGSGDVIYQYNIYSFSTVAIPGIISAFSFGFYASNKGHSEKPISSHFLFAVFFSISTVIAYYIGFSFYYMLEYILI